jgi:hypothetical protein
MPILPNDPRTRFRRSAVVTPRVPNPANATKRPGTSSRSTTTCKSIYAALGFSSTTATAWPDPMQTPATP